MSELLDRLRAAKATHGQMGGCKMLSLGDKCPCLLCLFDDAIAAVERLQPAQTPQELENAGAVRAARSSGVKPGCSVTSEPHRDLVTDADDGGLVGPRSAATDKRLQPMADPPAQTPDRPMECACGRRLGHQGDCYD